METYEDFDLRIVADGDGYRVLAQSSAGETSSSFKLPQSKEAHGETFPAGACRDLQAPPPAPRIPLQKIGSELFAALLNDSVRRLFDKAAGNLKSTPGRSLRIRIHIDPSDARLRPLTGIPWELLYCADTHGFLNLDRQTPIVRSLDALQSAVAAPLTSPLQVLLVMANPAGTPPLNLTEERVAVERAIRRTGSVEPSGLEHATCRELRHRLREKSFNVVHFMGHGSFDQDTDEGSLLLETSNRQADPISGEVLATLLRQGGGPALVVLNACKTAQSSEREESATPFTGVAASLVGKGIPAVLAMRTSVQDDAAITLTEELYERLAAGDPIEAAVSEARLALYAVSPSTSDWAIPALFVRSSAPNAPLAPLERQPEESENDSGFAETHEPCRPPLTMNASTSDSSGPQFFTQANKVRIKTATK